MPWQLLRFYSMQRRRFPMPNLFPLNSWGTTRMKKMKRMDRVATAVSADTAAAAPADFGNALARECAVSMTQPRGKFTMTVYEHGIHCVNAKNQVLSILPSSVEHLVMFPKPEDCRATSKPSGGDMVLLTLCEPTRLHSSTTRPCHKCVFNWQTNHHPVMKHGWIYCVRLCRLRNIKLPL